MGSGVNRSGIVTAPPEARFPSGDAVAPGHLRASLLRVGKDGPRGSGCQVPERQDHGSLQAAASLDKERGLALLAGRLLLVLLELAVPMQGQLLQELRREGRNIRAYQPEQPDDLHQARQRQGLLVLAVACADAGAASDRQAGRYQCRCARSRHHPLHPRSLPAQLADGGGDHLLADEGFRDNAERGQGDAAAAAHRAIAPSG
jgi:hypothetical protein